MVERAISQLCYKYDHLIEKKVLDSKKKKKNRNKNRSYNNKLS